MYVLAGSYPEPVDDGRAVVRADHKQWMTTPQQVRASSSEEEERNLNFLSVDRTSNSEIAAAEV